MRIQKLLSRAGVASRRRAEELMSAGRVRVNGEVVTVLGTRVDPARDVVEVDGTPVRARAARWIAFHKRAGFLTTRRDDRGRPTVFDDLPRELARLRYVGRLDLDTTGLLLLTNEGDAVHGLTHPSREVEREYRATVRGTPSQATLTALTRGVPLDDGPARAVRAEVVEPGADAVLGLVLTEGRKREVRRMLEAVGHPVLALSRVRFGPVSLGNLAPGAWRELDDDERARLRAAAGIRTHREA